MLILIRFKIWQQNLFIPNCIDLFSIKIDIFFIKFDQILIQRLKMSITILKKSSLIKEVNINWLFWLNLIIIDHFDLFWKPLIKSRHNLFNFVTTIIPRSKMSIKSWFVCDLSQNISLSQFNRLSLSPWKDYIIAHNELQTMLITTWINSTSHVSAICT